MARIGHCSGCDLFKFKNTTSRTTVTSYYRANLLHRKSLSAMIVITDILWHMARIALAMTFLIAATSFLH